MIEHKGGGNASRAREAELELIINRTPFMLTRCSRDLRYLFVSRAYAEMIGRRPEEISGKPIVEIMGEAGFKTILPHVEKVLRGDRVEYESEVSFEGVGTRFLHVVYTPEQDDSGHVKGWIASIIDITERKRAENALRESENRKSAILNTAVDAIVTMDHRGNVADFNPAAEAIFGYSRETVLSKPMADFIIPERLRERHWQGLARYLETGHGPVLGRPIEMPALRADGTEFPAELVLTRIVGIEPPMFTGFIRDITDRKRAQEILERTVEERTAQLRETVQELEAFSYSIAHDMRAPLRAMQGFATILSEECQIDANGEMYLERIRTSAQRLDQLIRDVLDYSKVVRGEISLMPVNTEELLKEVIATYPNFQRPDLKIEIASPLPVVQANPAALTQVFSNLLGNAVKFARTGVAPRIKIWAAPAEKPNAVRLWFEDNGIGIEQNSAKRLFQMFQRLNRPGLYEGTGMGLAIVRKAVERMGGTVGIDTEPGEGSRFWVELSRAQ